MYSVRESFQADPVGTLERLAQIGYNYVEFFTHDATKLPGVAADIPAHALKAELARVGIKVIGCHVGPLTEQTVDPAIAYHSELGNVGLGMSIDFWTSRQNVIDRCSFYNRVGEKCRKAGLQFYYHNHYHEFQTFDGDQVLDLIMANTDPELVKFELDAYWTFRGAVDPAAVLRQHPGRFILIHQKDFPYSEARHLDLWTMLDRTKPLDRQAFSAVIRPEEFTEVGDGMIKIQDVVDAGVETGVPYILVEQDDGRGRTEFERVERSLTNMRKMRGLDLS
jgi:sugar phosphate isomerase/epimerase